VRDDNFVPLDDLVTPRDLLGISRLSLDFLIVDPAKA
jgi:hypothetical protein